jgi:hypothetical protein
MPHQRGLDCAGRGVLLVNGLSAACCCGCSEIAGRLFPDLYAVETKALRHFRRVVTTRTVIRQRTETYFGGAITIANPIISDATTTETLDESVLLIDSVVAGRFEWLLGTTLTQSTGPQVEQSRTGDPPTDGTITYVPRFVTTVQTVVFEDYRLMAKVDLSNQFGLGELGPDGQPLIDVANLSFATGSYRFAGFPAGASNQNLIGVTAKWLADLEGFVTTNAEFDEAWSDAAESTNVSPVRIGPQLADEPPESLWVLFYSNTTRRGAALTSIAFVMGPEDLIGANATGQGIYDWRRDWDRIAVNEWRSKFLIPDDHYRFSIAGRSRDIPQDDYIMRGLEATVEASDWKLELTRNEVTPVANPLFLPGQQLAANRYNIGYTAKAVLTSGEDEAIAVFDNRQLSASLLDPPYFTVPSTIQSGNEFVNINVSDGLIGGATAVRDIIENTDPRGNSVEIAAFTVERGDPTREENYITVRDDAEHRSTIEFRFTRIRGNIETIVSEDDGEDDTEPEEPETQRFISTRQQFPDDAVANARCPAHFHPCWDVELEATDGLIEVSSSSIPLPYDMSTQFLVQRKLGCLTEQRTVRPKPYPYGYIELPYPNNPFGTILATDTLPDGRRFDLVSETFLTGGTDILVQLTLPPTPVSLTAIHQMSRVGQQFKSRMTCDVGFVVPNLPREGIGFTDDIFIISDQRFEAPDATYDEPITTRTANATGQPFPTLDVRIIFFASQGNKAKLAVKVYELNGTFTYYEIGNRLGEAGTPFNTIQSTMNYIKFGDGLGFNWWQVNGVPTPYNLFGARVDVTVVSTTNGLFSMTWTAE